MGVDDSLGKGETESGPPFFCREVRLKDPIEVFGRDPDSGVSDGHFKLTVNAPGSEMELPPVGHGLECVHDEVEECLVDLSAIQAGGHTVQG